MTTVQSVKKTCVNLRIIYTRSQRWNKTRRERYILLANTIVVIVIDIFIYIFFSVYTPILAEKYKPDYLKKAQH